MKKYYCEPEYEIRNYTHVLGEITTSDLNSGDKVHFGNGNGSTYAEIL